MKKENRCSATFLTNGVMLHPKTCKAWDSAKRNDDGSPMWDVDWKKVAVAMYECSSKIETQLQQVHEAQIGGVTTQGMQQ
jgi:hypothetical protein